jgi:predicted DNA-binding antitoxin AbrB/MazE fold protein
MVYRGHVENGIIRLEGTVVLPEGAEVRVELAAEREEFDPHAPPIEEVLAALWADVPEAEWRRLPADLTDHTVLQTARR